MNDILEYWPFPYEPRENQKQALRWLAEQEAKYLLLEAPVGSGKSNIGITYSRYLDRDSKRRTLGNSFILTPQRILQDQYEKSFLSNKKINLASLYGKSNYECSDKKTTCDIGSIFNKCDSCPYQSAKNHAKHANDVVLNYRLALLAFAFTKTFNKRNLAILDECHNTETHLVQFDTMRITYKRCEKYGLKFKTFDDISKALKWLNEYYVPEMETIVEKLEDEAETIIDKPRSSITKADMNTVREANKLREHLDEAVMTIMRKESYVHQHFALVNDSKSFEFKRLKGDTAFRSYLEPQADKFLFMSSTILDKDGFCSDIGIPSNQTAFLSLGSEFPPENRKVVYMPQMKMNASWRRDENETNRSKMIDMINKILEMHENESGIIHTGNFQIAQWLVNAVNSSHRVYHHNPDTGDSRDAVITAFLGDPKPSILISPSITEGLDLKDDLGRFAIFAKIPFGNLGDQWIKRRMEMSSNWYQRKALTDIIQGGGRVVRSSDDWGTTYILDQSWTYLQHQTKHMIPQWWKDGYIKL